MTAVGVGSNRRATTAAGFAVVAAGCLILMARPFSVPVLIAVFVGLGLVGWCWPLPRVAEPAPTAAVALPVLLIGVIAFAAGRLIGGGHPLLPATNGAIALNTLAAVAEEAFFRRLLFGLLLPFGAAIAIAGSAVAFALIHVSIYGWWVVPLDIAAGFILGWQRSASGTWAVPAVTHALANLLVVL
jgi:membrane protease YdiL (CAAX protease family)